MSMKILALDTSHTRGSVSISADGEVLCEILFDASDTHSATLMPAIDRCFAMSKLSPKEIALIGVVIGPGSFTGLRIGLATAKAFAASLKCPVVPVTSLETLAAAFPFSTKLIVPLIDARRREVYGAVYSTA
ncbi:MAG: tRNA (adenosine(37)-N6)-threonylcarbamoyltransferase complex dimerization subunit type 1 TsaB, partial [Candidatus Latescibacteria bacterium 4484_7]